MAGKEEDAMPMLTQGRLAETLAVKPALIENWRRDRVIPPHFFHRGERREFLYCPETLAVGLLVLALGSMVGRQSTFPTEVARQVASAVEQRWREPSSQPLRLRVTHGDTGIELLVPVDVIERARELAASTA